ncbi:MAG: UDP-N-acetylenolpyruvoylglucosamine reductase [Candidatus Niyogibacteria bacterium RIFCSPLOWO2_01_FULL_45_48]|uniref:UDP-N-acetylenolpyruvoylglucosamine reductase n=2 Tax=Candidatus Niyogiibacteriota TaxID=1817912 RepID=A0A1G2F1M1_9BACT|nr:MAG: UDP-N-acetylenolpyruvoylglucosamine reductase [Candidatus Niyogibacteria bacterium RIFCSPLOWO2_01_FULL_45_48]OGZ31045.1 MAG: UDP-N-acetylenolpyruvoylglucosamine reductase [Candidatus Niyogibacteria bacterium RIFCSPHIGHO2_01_FULL_45_28]OGZ31478.1 MAG: UDP-N-acetylenolpyruvoylglucosamine reductase [Candidatus Niyogibacteria bacterium RIFCSPLOWO2_02_FULL_45_13]
MLNIQENIELASHTVFKIGGPAKYFCETASANELAEAVLWAKEKNVPFFVLGAGSNVLVSDKGFEGLVIKNKATGIKLGHSVSKLVIEAEAGAQMARVVAESVKAGLSGFEWAIGIPGTIGGSVRGNAGCFGSEMKDVVESVDVFDAKNNANSKLPTANCDFGYRDSVFKHNPNLIILSATLKLANGDPKKSQSLVAGYAKKRAESQDIGQKCAGCIFKNVEWSRKDIDKTFMLEKFPELKQFSNQKSIPAGFLIDFLGLKNSKVGGAEISAKHANYFINTGGAVAEDVLTLAAMVKEKIQNHYGVYLEEEIQKLF